MFHPVEQKRASDIAISQMQKLIDSGKLNPGDKLPAERELTHQLSISRGTLREAIRLLEAHGILEVRPGLGTFIINRTINGLHVQLKNWLIEHQTQVFDLLTVRQALEPLAAGLAAERANEDDIAHMELLLEQIESSLEDGDLETMVRCDIKFHEIISKCSGNSFLMEINSGINISMMESRYAYLSLRDRAEASINEHRKVLKSIKEHDLIGASQVMSDHVSSAIDYYKQALLETTTQIQDADNRHSLTNENEAR